jgi:hypothetical protein
MVGSGYAASVAADVWDIAPAVGSVTLACGVGGVLAMGWLWRSTAPSPIEPAAPTMDLRDETPALVDLLTGGFDVDDDAVPATVVDLAARRYLDIDELGGEVTLRPRRESAPSQETLTPYERRVLAHVEQHTVNGVAPAKVLTTGPEGVSERWFRSFTREVNRHGQSLGLCRRRFDLKHLAIAWAIVVVGGGPGWLIAQTGPRTTDPAGWGTVGNLLVGLSLLVSVALAWLAISISKSDRQTDTPAGRAAASHWLGVREHMRSVGDFEDKPAASVAIWDRYLAHATAMGLAPLVERQLPFDSEHDRAAWSMATGRWRRVRVRYQAIVPQWGQSPVKVVFEGLIQAAVTGVLAYGAFLVSRDEFDLTALDDDQRRWVSLAAFAVSVLAVAVCAYASLKVLLGLSDLFSRRSVEGEVVRARELQSGHRLPKVVQWLMYSGQDEHGRQRNWNRRVRHHLAIDEGDDDSIVAFVVRPQLYRQVPQGARVRAVVTSRLGYVRSVEVTAPPRRSAAHAPSVPHELVEESTQRAGAAVVGSMQRALADLEGATDEDGVPILDQVDEEGVTVRERLRESSAQIEALRTDPRLQNSPLAGFLDAFTQPSTDRPDDRPPA